MNITKIYKTREEFDLRENKLENGVSPEFSEANPKWEKENGANEGCYDCYDCSRCSRCSRCSGCYDCYDCVDKKSKEGSAIPIIPIVPNIHAKILEAVTVTGTLDMSNFHTCETTHCRAGWAIHLAGKAGKDLENLTSSEFAGMQIFHASSLVKVSPVRFYESNKKAMEDIKRCAAEEAKLSQTI